ncbi:glycosyltransferase [Vibrio amylolyticus]|uniref:glycosyltransferase n=1 Tax=Vibrio amylolyticus TaxID=2847292 RepID=UPI003553FEAC
MNVAKTILHIHQDFPDGRPYPSTKAVAQLIKASQENNNQIKHLVISINRTSNPFRVSFKRFEHGYSLVYWCLPINFFYSIAIYFWALVLVRLLSKEKFEIVHAHKLTTEGMFAYFISSKLKVNYVCSIRGGSDLHNLNKYKICSKYLFKKVFLNAKILYWVSPWAKNSIKQYMINSTDAKEFSLPNIVSVDSIEPTLDAHLKQGISTIVSFHQYERKGLFTLIDAIKALNDKGKALTLSIIGSGDNATTSLIQTYINSLSLDSQVELVGQLPNNLVLKKLKFSKIFVLPAKQETFGMCYVESIACGTPFIQIANTGVDGFFEEPNTNIKISNQDVVECAAAIESMLDNYEQYILGLSDYYNSGKISNFTSTTVSTSYLNSMNTYA